MRLLSLRFHLLLAALLCAMPVRLAQAQSGAASADRPAVGLHDSIDVASLEFAGAHEVTPAELKLVVFTRTSSCRLVLIAPLCKLSRSQLFIDRRRTTPAALGEDITKLPMYERARRGIGYLSQEPSIFRKLSVEDNILAILETLPLSAEERSARLEKLLDELSIKRLRKSKAYALSGGERRRLEITRALVTDPKFMMLDEPFAGVDPIAVHDIQTIVAGLRHRGIGVLISDHNVEQTLDIVDRAYIMFDGQVKVSGTVRDLVFDDTVADIYLGPTLTARLRERFSRGRDEVTAS